MSDAIEGFLDEWHRVVAQRDLDGIPGLLAEDISLGAPPYWNRFEGRELVQHLLGVILQTIEGFTYHREWRSGSELALEFRGKVGELELQGIDLISLNEQGVVRNLDVLMRPANAIGALQTRVAPRMAEFLAKRAADASGSH